MDGRCLRIASEGSCTHPKSSGSSCLSELRGSVEHTAPYCRDIRILRGNAGDYFRFWWALPCRPKWAKSYHLVSAPVVHFRFVESAPVVQFSFLGSISFACVLCRVFVFVVICAFNGHGFRRNHRGFLPRFPLWLYVATTSHFWRLLLSYAVPLAPALGSGLGPGLLC